MVFSLCEYTHGLEAACDLLLLSTSPPLFSISSLSFNLSLPPLLTWALLCSLPLCFIIPCVHYFLRRCFLTQTLLCAALHAHTHMYTH